MRKIAKQYLRIYPEGGGLVAGPISMAIVEPNTKCPVCGKPWKEGAFYAHRYCCGCPTCGYSMCVLAVSQEELDELRKI